MLYFVAQKKVGIELKVFQMISGDLNHELDSLFSVQESFQGRWIRNCRVIRF